MISAALWKVIEALLSAGIAVAEWLLVKNEELFDALAVPLAEYAVARGWL